VLYRNETTHAPYELQVIPKSTIYSLKDFTIAMASKMYLKKEEYFNDCAIVVKENII
jgi:hypothetical protein